MSDREQLPQTDARSPRGKQLPCCGVVEMMTTLKAVELPVRGRVRHHLPQGQACGAAAAAQLWPRHCRRWTVSWGAESQCWVMNSSLLLLKLCLAAAVANEEHCFVLTEASRAALLLHENFRPLQRQNLGQSLMELREVHVLEL